MLLGFVKDASRSSARPSQRHNNTRALQRIHTCSIDEAGASVPLSQTHTDSHTQHLCVCFLQCVCLCVCVEDECRSRC